MPSRSSPQPVFVEVRPSNLKTKSFGPPSPGSPKAVRFAEAAQVRQVPRRLSTVEAWSAYHFENHARSCQHCFNPLDVQRRGDRLCDLGRDLAQDVAEHIHYHDGQNYSTQQDNQKPVRVELEEGYDQVQQLLRAKSRTRRSPHRTVPIITYDSATHDSPPTRHSPRTPEEVYIEPATSRRKSKHRSSRYEAVANDDDLDYHPSANPTDHRRGSLYVKDIQQRQRREAYKVEIREPAGAAEEEADHHRSRARRRRYHVQTRPSDGYFA